MKDKREDLPHLLALCFSFLTACIIGRRLGVRGSAVFALLYVWQFFFFILVPLGCAFALRELTARRFALSLYSNASRIFRVALITLAFYLLVVSLVWLIGAEHICVSFFGDRSMQLPFMLMLFPFVLNSLSIILLAYNSGRGDVAGSAYILMLRQLALLIMVFLFSGRGLGSLKEVAMLYQSRNVTFSREAAVIAFMMGAASLLCLTLCILKLLGGSAHMRRKDNANKPESAAGMLYATALPFIALMLLLFLVDLIATLFLLRGYASRELPLRAYHLGIYLTQNHSLLMLPLTFLLMLHMRAANQVSLGIRGGDVAELRFRMKSLTDVSGMIGCCFSLFQLFLAPLIEEALFASRSDFGVRILRLGAFSLFFAAYGLCACLQLALLKSRKQLFFAYLPAFALFLLVFLPLHARERLGIYALQLSVCVFFLVLAICGGYGLKNKLRYTPDARTAFVLPLIASAIPALVCCLLSLLLGLFLPPLLGLLIVSALYFLLCFFLLCMFGCVNSYMLRSIPMGAQLSRLGRILRVLK